MRNKLETQKEQIIRNLKKDELKQYISQLAKRYYVTFINDEGESHNSVITEFYDIISMFEDTYPNIKNYINHCLVKSANELLQDLFQRDFILKCPTSVDIEANKSNVTINLLERVKEKRKELYDLDSEL